MHFEHVKDIKLSMFGKDKGLANVEPRSFKATDLTRWGLNNDTAYKIVKALEGRSIEEKRKLRKDRWDQPECRVLRSRLRQFFEDDEVSFLSDTVSDTVEIEGRPERVREVVTNDIDEFNLSHQSNSIFFSFFLQIFLFDSFFHIETTKSFLIDTIEHTYFVFLASYGEVIGQTVFRKILKYFKHIRIPPSSRTKTCLCEICDTIR